MEKNNTGEYSSINYDYEKLISSPFLYEVMVRVMTCEEILDFYMYVLNKYTVSNKKKEYKTILEDLEGFDVVQLFINGDFTSEEIVLFGGKGKDNANSNSSFKDYFQRLLDDSSICYSKIDEMEYVELVQFYRYVISVLNYSRNVKECYWEVVSYLEEMPIIQAYNECRLGDKCDDMSLGKINLTEEEREQIDETVLLLEKRRKISPFKKLMKVIKG